MKLCLDKKVDLSQSFDNSRAGPFYDLDLCHLQSVPYVIHILEFVVV